MSDSHVIRRLLASSAQQLGGAASRVDAELLLAHALDRSRAWLYAHADEHVDDPSLARFEELLAARLEGTPIAYLLGQREFWSLPLQVNRQTLIPRPETELLVELSLGKIAPDRCVTVLDLGTGSGAIALAIACERPLAQVLAVDVSPGALAVAQVNGDALHELGASLASVEWMQSDWFSALSGRRFDVIASNPPYLAEDDPHLQTGDLRFEPRSALASGADGLDAIRQIISSAPEYLTTGGWLLLEHGWTQGAVVRNLLVAAGFGFVATHRDLEDRERVSCGRRD
ncbi:MAG: peptide chain release factor N(5)-glutamine methyltransferase [Lysobacteraceae bacterium]